MRGLKLNVGRSSQSASRTRSDGLAVFGSACGSSQQGLDHFGSSVHHVLWSESPLLFPRKTLNIANPCPASTVVPSPRTVVPLGRDRTENTLDGQRVPLKLGSLPSPSPPSPSLRQSRSLGHPPSIPSRFLGREPLQAWEYHPHRHPGPPAPDRYPPPIHRSSQPPQPPAHSPHPAVPLGPKNGTAGLFGDRDHRDPPRLICPAGRQFWCFRYVLSLYPHITL